MKTKFKHEDEIIAFRNYEGKGIKKGNKFKIIKIDKNKSFVELKNLQNLELIKCDFQLDKYFDLNPKDITIRPIKCYEDLVFQLSYIRECRMITQKELADRVGVKQPMIQGIETGSKKLNFKRFFLIIDALNLDFDIKEKS